MKRSDVLDRVEDEAGVSYEGTALARRAAGARKRLSLVLLLGTGALLVEVAVSRQPLWLAPALAAGLAAWGVRKGRLGALLGGAFLATLAVLVPLAWLGVGPRDPASVVTALVSVALGASALPDVVVLLRDAELQHAYGLWARRDG